MEEDQVRKYRNQVKRNIDYFEISEDYAANLEQLDEIVDLMHEYYQQAQRSRAEG